MYIVRFLGGTLYLSGFILMTWNLIKTALAGKAVNGSVEVPVEAKSAEEPGGVRAILLGKPLWFSTAIFATGALFVLAPIQVACGAVVAVVVLGKVWW